MNRALAVVAILFCLLTSGTSRAEEKPVAAVPTGADLRITLSGLGLPIVREGRLVNYVFIRAQIQAKPGLTKEQVMTQEPVIRAGVLRAAFRAPLNPPGDFASLDRAQVEAVLMQEAQIALGAGKVQSVALLDQKPRNRVPPLAAAGAQRESAIVP